MHSWQKELCEQTNEGGKDRMHSRISKWKNEAVEWKDLGNISTSSSLGPAYGRLFGYSPQLPSPLVFDVAVGKPAN